MERRKLFSRSIPLGELDPRHQRIDLWRHGSCWCRAPRSHCPIRHHAQHCPLHSRQSKSGNSSSWCSVCSTAVPSVLTWISFVALTLQPPVAVSTVECPMGVAVHENKLQRHWLARAARERRRLQGPSKRWPRHAGRGLRLPYRFLPSEVPALECQ